MTLTIRPEWLAQVTEEIVDPGRRIIDPHHHFFTKNPTYPYYDLTALHADTSGHGVLQTVYLQCWEGYRTEGLDAMQVVGETEWVDQIATLARNKPEAAQIGAIMATADLRLGARVRDVLEAHQAASPLFRGIRQIAAWDPSADLNSRKDVSHANLYGQDNFRQGFKTLALMGLTFDAYHYFHQTPYLTALAQNFPEIQIVLDHFGTPLGVGPYARRREEIYAVWARDLTELARCPNVALKLGGLAMPRCGFGFENQAIPPNSDQIVAAQGHYYHHAIEAFGPSRCMFESNFPVDKCAVSYTVLWNAFKKMAARYSVAEQNDLFAGTARRVYRIA